jgi:hypothetical protein
MEPRSPSHATHVPAALQIGVVPEHCAFVVHCTHVWVVSLHAGFGGTQRIGSAVVHCTQLPVSAPALTHAGFVVVGHASPAPEPLSPLHGTHLPVSQTGVVPEHCELLLQATHWFVVVLQNGVAPPQSPSPKHCTHCMVASLQRGVGTEQFASVAHPAVHVLLTGSQMPSGPKQSGLVRHWTHRFVDVLHTGSAAGQAVWFVALHSTHAPDAMHAGSAALVH